MKITMMIDEIELDLIEMTAHSVTVLSLKSLSV